MPVNKAIQSVKKGYCKAQNKDKMVQYDTRNIVKKFLYGFFYTKSIRELDNPMLLLLTDRTDLDRLKTT